MKKPLIGVIPLIDLQRESFWMLPGYMQGVEAVCLPEATFVWAVQWHPEFSFRSDANSLKIFTAFVDACRIFASKQCRE